MALTGVRDLKAIVFTVMNSTLMLSNLSKCQIVLVALDWNNSFIQVFRQSEESEQTTQNAAFCDDEAEIT